MSTIVLNADSTTLVLNGRAITSFVAGDILTLTPANPATSHVNSSNGGVNINKRTDADVYDLLMRVQRYSEDDVFLNSALNSNPLTVFNGSVKENYQRDGGQGVESWTLENGSITTQPTVTKNDQDGNGLMEYTIRFRSARRSL